MRPDDCHSAAEEEKQMGGARLTADEARRLANEARGLPSIDELVCLILSHASEAAIRGKNCTYIIDPKLEEAIRMGHPWVAIKEEIESLGFSLDWEAKDNGNFFRVRISWV
jgi:hypothetical protein